MAWCRPGDMPLSQIMMVRLTHICVTQWVKSSYCCKVVSCVSSVPVCPGNCNYDKRRWKSNSSCSWYFGEKGKPIYYFVNCRAKAKGFSCWKFITNLEHHHMASGILVNTGPGNGLMPDGTKPLPKQKTYCWHNISEIIWLLFHGNVYFNTQDIPLHIWNRLSWNHDKSHREQLHEPRIFYPSGHWPETVTYAHVSAHFR